MLARLLFVFLCAAMGCAYVHGSTPLRVGTNIWPGYEPLYLAAQRQRWTQLGVRLVEYRSASEVLRAFRNRALEAAALTLDEVLALVEAELPVQVVAVLDISEGGDVILANPRFQRFADLRGQRIGVESGALGAYVLSRALELNDLGIADLEIVHMDVSQHESAYRDGRVDAVVTFEPVRTRLLAAGATELFSSAAIPGEIVDVLVVHQDVLQQRGAVIAKLVADWFATLAYMSAEPAAAAAFTARRLRISPEEVQASYQGLSLPDLAKNRQMLGGGLDPSLRRLRDLLVQQKLLRRSVPLDALLQPAYLPD
ncbi:MAG: ABC transporter substrate-binding protein [Pseudomonadales bacterium]